MQVRDRFQVSNIEKVSDKCNWKKIHGISRPAGDSHQKLKFQREVHGCLFLFVACKGVSLFCLFSGFCKFCGKPNQCPLPFVLSSRAERVEVFCTCTQ